MSRVLEGRTAIITGSSQGFGLAVARAYVQAGANVLLCARNKKELLLAQMELTRLAYPGQVITSQVVDISKPDDVERLISTAFSIFNRVHILINNAGVYGPKGLIEDVNWDEWVRAVEINLFGSVLTCRGILPHFKKHKYGKIIQLSGGGATAPMPRFSAYAASKAAIVRFVETLAEEVRQDHVDVNAIAPGALNTRLLDEVLVAGPEKVGEDFYNRSLKQKQQGGADMKRGTDLAVFLGSAASDGISGKLISSIWDPWESLPDHVEDLKLTDIYTLRRITPKDRGYNW